MTPAAWASVGEEPAAIVLENAGAYAVARAVLSRQPRPRYGMVVFGDGGRFERSVKSLVTIGRRIARLHYVGDLDGAGVRIAIGAARAAAHAGLPPLEAAPQFHRMMLDAAARLGAPHGWPALPGRRTPVSEGAARGFLPPEVVDRVMLILGQDRRVPEEALGPEDVDAALQAAPA